MRDKIKCGVLMNENDARAELFAALRDLSEIVHEMRAGQLMAAIGELCADLHGRGLWDASDADLLESVWQFRRNFEPATAASGTITTFEPNSQPHWQSDWHTNRPSDSATRPL